MIRTAYLRATKTQPSQIYAKSDDGGFLIEDRDPVSQDPHKDVAEKLAGGSVKRVRTLSTGFLFKTIGE